MNCSQIIDNQLTSKTNRELKVQTEEEMDDYIIPRKNEQQNPNKKNHRSNELYFVEKKSKKSLKTLKLSSIKSNYNHQSQCINLKEDDDFKLLLPLNSKSLSQKEGIISNKYNNLSTPKKQYLSSGYKNSTDKDLNHLQQSLNKITLKNEFIEESLVIRNSKGTFNQINVKTERTHTSKEKTTKILTLNTSSNKKKLSSVKRINKDYKLLYDKSNSINLNFSKIDKRARKINNFYEIMDLKVYELKIYYASVKWNHFIERINPHLPNNHFKRLETYIIDFDLLYQNQKSFITLNYLNYIQSKFIKNFYAPKKNLSILDTIFVIFFRLFSIGRLHASENKLNGCILEKYLSRAYTTSRYIESKLKSIVAYLTNKKNRSFLYKLLFEFRENLENIRTIHFKKVISNMELLYKRIRFSVVIDMYIMMKCIENKYDHFIEDYEIVFQMFDYLKKNKQFDFSKLKTDETMPTTPKKVDQIIEQNSFLIFQRDKYIKKIIDFENLILEKKIIENFIESLPFENLAQSIKVKFHNSSSKKNVLESQEKKKEIQRPSHLSLKHDDKTTNPLCTISRMAVNDSIVNQSSDTFIIKSNMLNPQLIKRNNYDVGANTNPETCKFEDNVVHSRELDHEIKRLNFPIIFDAFGIQEIKKKFQFNFLNLEEFNLEDKKALKLIVKHFDSFPETAMKAKILQKILSSPSTSMKEYLRNLEIVSNFMEELDIDSLNENLGMKVIYFLYKARKLICFIRENFFRTIQIK